MHVVIDRQNTTPIYLQVARQLRQAILDGDPPAGGRLPPERRLAALLGVNRTTIVNAYRELAADGLVAGQVGRGTIVTHTTENGASAVDATADWHDAVLDRRPRPGVPWSQLFTTVTDVLDDPLLRDTMTASARPDIVRLASGVPSPELYPVDLIRELLDEALHDAGQTLLQYTPTEGFAPLRDELARWMTRSATQAGAHATFNPREIVVVAGSQQGLYLLARTLIEPGDIVAVESPTYLGAAQVFRAAGARLLPIPVDDDGMQVDVLQDLLARRKPKLIYTLPSFQNPTGATLTMGRRRRLLDLAARYQAPIIEEDPYGALRYEGRDLPSLAALERADGGTSSSGNVIYVSTVSKMLFPGFRIGWIAAPKPVVEQVTLMKQLVDLDTNALAQWAVWAFFARGLLDSHLATVRAVYPRRRDLMLTALARHVAPLVRANKPSGGIYLWCRLAEGLRARDLLPEAAREGVVFAPGEPFHVDATTGRGRYNMRLNFTLPDEHEIEEGIRRLGVAARRLAERHALRALDIREDERTPIV